MRSVLVAACLASAAAGCNDRGAMTCDPAKQGTDCLQGGIHGVCTPTCDGRERFCAFPAPLDCPGTELKFGVLSGDESGRCVEECSLPADAGAEDGGAEDAQAPAPPSTVYVASSLGQAMWLFDASDLRPLGTVPLPQSQGGGHRIMLAGDTLWMTAERTIARYDLPALTVTPGYPRHIDVANECEPKGSVFGPEGWTCISGETLQRWTGEPLTRLRSRGLRNPGKLARSESRILAAFDDDESKIAVFDTGTLNQVPGSPMATRKVFRLFSDARSDRAFAITSDTSFHVTMWRQSDLELLGDLDLGSTPAWAVVTDSERGRVIISLGSGFVASYSLDNLAVQTPPVAVASKFVVELVYDASRTRLYGIAPDPQNSALVALDGDTFGNISGSPVLLPGSVNSIVVH